MPVLRGAEQAVQDDDRRPFAVFPKCQRDGHAQPPIAPWTARRHRPLRSSITIDETPPFRPFTPARQLRSTAPTRTLVRASAMIGKGSALAGTAKPKQSGGKQS